MSLRVEISGSAISLREDSLSISDVIEERSTASFDVLDLTSSEAIVKGNPVEIYNESDELIFAGFVEIAEKQEISRDAGLVYTIQCVDNHYLADKRIAAGSYLNQTAGYIVDDLFDAYLAPEGVTIGEIQDGIIILETIVNYVRLSEVFNALAEKCGFIWYISYDKKLYFIKRSTNVAPWELDSAYTTYESVKLTQKNPQYRNTQFVRGGWATTSTQTEHKTGDGVLKSVTTGFPIIEAPTISAGGVAKTVGIKGLDSGKDYYWSKGDSIILAEVAPAVGVDVVISYKGQYRIVVRSDNPAEIVTRQAIEGGTGIVEETDIDTETNTMEAAFESANGKLTKYCKDGRQLTFRTSRAGLRSGQFLTVNLPNLGLMDTELLIESMDITLENGYLYYSVTAIEGPEQGSWAKIFKLITLEKVAIDKINIGEEGTLVITSATNEGVGLHETVTEAVAPVLNLQVAANNQNYCISYESAAWSSETKMYAGVQSITKTKMGCGFYFPSVTIPAGATIIRAYLSIRAYAANDGVIVNTKITGNKESVPAVFSSVANYQARRGTIVGGADDTKITTAQVNWDGLEDWTADVWYQSPDITTVIQELVSAHAPTAEPLVLFWDDHNNRSTAMTISLRNSNTEANVFDCQAGFLSGATFMSANGFIPPVSYLVTSVKVKVKKGAVGGGYPATLYAEIRTVIEEDTDTPSDTVLCSGSIAISGLTSSYVEYEITMGTPEWVYSGTHYDLVLRTSAGDGVVDVWFTENSTPCSGNMWGLMGEYWITPFDYEMYFKIYGDQTPIERTGYSYGYGASSAAKLQIAYLT